MSLGGLLNWMCWLLYLVLIVGAARILLGLEVFYLMFVLVRLIKFRFMMVGLG